MRAFIPTLITLSLAASPVLAQEASEPSPADASDTRAWTKSQNNRAGIELDFFNSSVDRGTFGGGSVSRTGISITPVLQFELVDDVYLDVELPIGYGSTSFGNQSEGSFLFGNPTLGAHYAKGLSDRLAFFVGGSVSIPTIHDPDFSTLFGSLFNVAPLRANYEIYRYVPEAIGIRGRAGVEVRILPSLIYRGDINPNFFIPTGGGNAVFLIDQGNEIEYRLDSGLGFGGRFQATFILTDTSDHVQTALEPFVSYEPRPSGLYARAGLLMALDEQLGFAFDEGKILTGRMAVGYKW
ncbi:hypothetical protein [Chondromyces crocatus]|uniref:Secreted protein n=1 Tax=Chondromyces crocatus TaxID=52 RepID=A0A0K1ECR9_CHOCO|nr:hypothetical protein [Chondromyces crocatus]AKT38634.1 uncharacterized protein CMC5_027810 [Chondromyces crocatus]